MKRPSRTAATRLRRNRQARNSPAPYTTGAYKPVVATSQGVSATKMASRTPNRRKIRPGQTQPRSTLTFINMFSGGNAVMTLEPLPVYCRSPTRRGSSSDKKIRKPWGGGARSFSGIGAFQTG